MTRDPEAEARRLVTLLSQLQAMKTAYDSQFPIWRDEVRLVLKRTYGEDSEEYARFSAIKFEATSWGEGSIGAAFKRGVTQTKVFLDARIDELAAKVTTEYPQPVTKMNVDVSNEKIFVVHGHDHGMKETVARFLSKLGLNPIILHELPDQGHTIIEKFEQHSDVPFAVALFSKDDLGVSNIEVEKSPASAMGSLLRSRGRQNVVFECGYFIGRLGRKRVAVLHADGVEMMSDYSGVVYIPFDAGDGWRTRLFKELKAAGFNLDANKLFN